MLPIKFLSAIIENKDKTFLSFNKINSDTILFKMADDTDLKVSHPDLDEINLVRIHSDFKNTIQAIIDDYIFDINYSYNPVRVSKKHKDVEIYQDLNQIGEIISNNSVQKIKISDNLLTFVFDNNNEMEYLLKGYNFKLLDSKIRTNDIVLQFTSGIYSIVKHQNDFHIFKLSNPKIKFESKVLGFSNSEIELECQRLNKNNCTNTILSSKYQDKTISYNTKELCRVKQEKCIMRENLDQMNISYLDFNF
jgi:hypothetical protein